MSEMDANSTGNMFKQDNNANIFTPPFASTPSFTSLKIPNIANPRTFVMKPQNTPVDILEPFPVIKLPMTPQPSLENINSAVDKELEKVVIPEAIIKSEDILPISERPASPRDTTPIIVDGSLLDRESIPRIQIEDDALILPASHIAHVKIPSSPDNLVKDIPKIVPNPIEEKPSVKDIPKIVPNPIEEKPSVKDDPVAPQKSSTVVDGEISKIRSNIPKYSSMSLEEQAHYRAEFRTKFGILRRAWPNFYIPDNPESMSLEEIHVQYDVYIRTIHISKEVDQYKVYLVIGWLIIEFFLSKLGLNVAGYTIVQMKSMNKYERLLLELGETNHKEVAGEAKSIWPVEIKILFVALTNAAMFIIIKLLATYIGEQMASSIVDALSSYLSGTPAQPGQVLFGGTTPIQDNNTAPVGGQPLPDNNTGQDWFSVIGQLGSLVLNNQRPAAPASNHTNVPRTPTTPKFKPAYDE